MTNTFEKEIIEEFRETCLLYMADAKVDKAQSLRQCGKLSIALQDALHQQRIKDAEEFEDVYFKIEKGLMEEYKSELQEDTRDSASAFAHSLAIVKEGFEELRKKLERMK